MGAKSTIRRLPIEVQEEILGCLNEGFTVDELVDLVKERAGADISRSAMGRFAQKARPSVEKVYESRQVAKAMAKELGADDGSMNQGIINILQSSILNIVQTITDDGELDLKTLNVLTRSVRELAVASKSNIDAVARAREEGRKIEQEKAMKAIQEKSETLGITDKTRDELFEILEWKS